MTLSWPLTKRILRRTFREVADDDVTTLAAAIAYYTVFSLPPLLVIVVAIAGAIYGPDTIVDLIERQASQAIGPSAGEAIRTMIENASSVGTGIGSKVVGVVALLFGATGAFGQLQKALNRAWEVDESKEEGGLTGLLTKRVLSFGMVVTIAFLLLVSLVVSSVLTALGDAASSVAGGGVVGFGVQVLNVAVSFGITVALFAVLFRYLPDVHLKWRDVGVGAAVTAVLFTLGKTALGVYLGRAEPGSAFGAAGSLALLLVWIYYSSLIILVGAEFTQAWTSIAGDGLDAGDGRDAGDAPEVTVGEPSEEVHPLATPRDPAPY